MLSKLNPKKSLFGLIFIWFWVAVILMITSAFIVSRVINRQLYIHAPSEQQLLDATNVAENVQRMLDRGNGVGRTLRRLGRRGEHHLMMVNPETENLFLSFPNILLRNSTPYIRLSENEFALVSRTQNLEFVGPFDIQHNDKLLKLFVGRLLEREERSDVALFIALGVFLVLGSLACLGIASTITRPIRRLSQRSLRFASGEPVKPDASLQKRTDEIGRLHHDINKMANDLSRSLQQQKHLMANISHELRTPLTRMQLAIAMIEHKNEQSETYSKRLEKEIVAMDKLIGQTLQLSKFDTQANHLTSKPESVEIHELLTSLLEDLKFEASVIGIDLVTHALPNTRVSLQPSPFTSAIENVTRNAIKYAESRVELRIEHAADYINVTIEDDGRGLDCEQLEQIFTPFYRAPSSIEKHGTGLGLAIAKAAVELHEGNITAEQSKYGGLQMKLSFKVKIE